MNRVVKRCSLFDNRIFVSANGDVLACCHDLDGQSRLGTVGKDSLVEVMEVKLARQLEGRLYSMCALCDDKNAAVSCD